jgi:hypothetical protein
MKLAIELAKDFWLPIFILAGLIWLRVRMWKAHRAHQAALNHQRQEQALFEALYAPTLTDEEVNEYHAMRWSGDGQ